MSAFPVRRVSARRAARHPKAAFLVAADEHSLLDLELLIATLPMCATGRIFVEVADASQIVPIVVPPRMTLTFFDRSRTAGNIGGGFFCQQGRALTRAVNAWADEMMCAEDDETTVHLLAGFLASADIAEHLENNVGIPRSRVHAPVVYGR